MKTTKVKIIWLLAIVIQVFFGAHQLQAADSVDVTQAQSMNKQGALLLDVRDPGEYVEIHATNAKLIPLEQLSSRIQEIAMYKDKPIAVMCHSGRRSAQAVRLLQQAGFSQVSNVNGGMVAWEKAGLEVSRKP